MECRICPSLSLRRSLDLSRGLVHGPLAPSLGSRAAPRFRGRNVKDTSVCPLAETMMTEFYSAMRRAGMEKAFRFHDLRQYAVSCLIQQGAAPLVSMGEKSEGSAGWRSPH